MISDRFAAVRRLRLSAALIISNSESGKRLVSVNYHCSPSSNGFIVFLTLSSCCTHSIWSGKDRLATLVVGRVEG